MPGITFEPKALFNCSRARPESLRTVRQDNDIEVPPRITRRPEMNKLDVQDVMK